MTQAAQLYIETCPVAHLSFGWVKPEVDR